MASITVSTASSPTFWAILLMPFENKLATYDLLVSLLATRSEITSSKVDKKPKFELLVSAQQVSVPLWQVGPAGCT